MLCGSRRPKGGSVIHQLALDAIDGDQHIWSPAVIDINEAQCDDGLVCMWSQDTGGGEHVSAAWITGGKFDDGHHTTEIERDYVGSLGIM